ncbi:hypothetical protein SPHINGO391_510002 [Sphingomonas aurantiaca]|uniref:Uncharacterized protein n=1 Tax=Sphingomonas aurantiaca TaxID=185949 RepID=A0A5E8ABR9_9SPHN|nr:hypothetical protein SPHINGO391_510002 [Sphingomonas aurantiaca]
MYAGYGLPRPSPSVVVLSRPTQRPAKSSIWDIFFDLKQLRDCFRQCAGQSMYDFTKFTA